MKLKILKILILLIGINIIVACSIDEKTVSIKEAYNDGFEVILINGKEINNLNLRKADEVIKQSNLSTFLIPVDKISWIEKELKKINKPNSTYPLIGITVKENNNQKQIIDLSFNYSNRSFHFCYEATEKTVNPLWSSVQDLGKHEKTIYK